MITTLTSEACLISDSGGARVLPRLSDIPGPRAGNGLSFCTWWLPGANYITENVYSTGSVGGSGDSPMLGGGQKPH